MAYYGTVSSESPKVNQPKILLWIALAIAVVGVFLSLQALWRGTAEPIAAGMKAESRGPKVLIVRKVLIAADDIQPGERLIPSLFTIEARPTEGDPQSFITDISFVEKRYAHSKIQKGSIIRREDVIDSPLPGGRLTESIPNGYRAVTIQVDEAGGIEGWASPEVRVDVVWSSIVRGKPVVTTVVENAKILSIDKTVAPQKGNTAPAYSVPRSVTLLVKKKDGQRIQLARQSGKLSLSLRGEADRSYSGAETTLVDKLLEPHRETERKKVKGTVSVDGKKFELIGMDLVPAGPIKNVGK